jgi:hypothetical protein
MSLIPEKPIAFSPTLAATLGLEEAILVQVLQECVSHYPQTPSSGYTWVTVSGENLLKLVPFWGEQDIGRLTASLHEKGLLLIGGGPFSAQGAFRFAFNDRTVTAAARQPLSTVPSNAPQLDTPSSGPRSAKAMGISWQPSEDTLRQLAQLGVTGEFARQQIPQFVSYWRERNVPRHSWESKFIKEVWRQWQQAETAQQRQLRKLPISNQWRPSEDALHILSRQGGINANFIEDAIPEFVLYWRSSGEVSSTWDSKFIQHVRHQWQFYNGAINQDKLPRPMTADWQPVASTFDILQMANIDADFARQLIPEFILYWQENGSAQCSWSTKYLQYVKRQWARHIQPQAAETNHGKQQGSHSASRIRDRNIIDALSDRSWAS